VPVWSFVTVAVNVMCYMCVHAGSVQCVEADPRQAGDGDVPDAPVAGGDPGRGAGRG